jgi:methylenetetrahydrofolate reductase (NADPH)
LRKKLRGDGFLKVVEVLPPKGARGEGFEERLIPLKGLVDAVYIPHLPGAVMRAGSAFCAHFLHVRGYEVIFEVNCAHSNRLAIQAELLGAGLLGLKNVVLSEGDDPKWGDHPEAKAVFDINLKQLLEIVKAFREGKDLVGGDLEGALDLCVGVKVDASLQGDGLKREWDRMEEMARLGVEFFLSSSVYDLEQLERFMEGASKIGVPVIAGLIVLKSAGMARYINKHVPGVMIPERVIEKLLRSPDKELASIEVAVEALKGIRRVCQGVNFITIGWEDKVSQILKEADILWQ